MTNRWRTDTRTPIEQKKRGLCKASLIVMPMMGLAHGEMYHFLCLKVLFGKEVGNIPRADFFLEGSQFGGQVTPFEIENAIGKVVVARGRYFSTHPLHKLREVGNSPGDDEIVFALYLLGSHLLGSDIGELQLVGHILHYLDFFPYGIDKMEFCIGEHDGQRDAGKTAASTYVEYLGHGAEGLHLSNGKAVEDMMLIEIVHVLARNDIDFGVPVTIKGQQGGKLFFLPLCKVWEIF